ncbi:MAG: peptide chain release factor N(5)-glutamine methyltransferase [Oscillospiraceae bacterium]
MVRVTEAKVDTVKTYNEIYFEARKWLKSKGIEAYNLESRLIVSKAAGKTKEEFVRDSVLYVNDGFEEKVEELIKRRLSGEPVAYITGEWEFYGLPIEVTPDVLIPRIDTEILADTAIEILKTRESGTRVLDLCSGSGCLGIAVAANVPDCRVILLDDSVAALKQSRINVIRNSLTRSVTCIDADALGVPPMLLGRFDMIVCNPPYIPSKEIKRLDHSVKDYEPRRALDGGDDGLRFYRNIAARWKVILKEGGALLFECGAGQADTVKLIMSANGFKDITVAKDTIGVDRVVCGII